MKYLLLIILNAPIILSAQDKTAIIDTRSIPSVYIPPSHNLDTIPSSILVSHKAPSFGHAVNGYCVYQYGACTKKHIRYWRKRWVVIGPEYVVWGCIRRDQTTVKNKKQ